MLYPGIRRDLEVLRIAETVNDTRLGKPGPLEGEAAVPKLDISGMRDNNPGKPAEGCVDAWMMIDGKVEMKVIPADVGIISDEPLGGATHFVHMVEIEVRVTVDKLVVTSWISLVPELIVLVTGQVVKVV